MKTIGLVGGMTPESTRAYYDRLIRSARTPGADPLRNPEIIIYSLDLSEVVRLQREADRGAVVDHLSGYVERLRLAGAEIGALTANTPHAYLDELEAATSLPLVSIVTATRDAAVALGVQHALLLGTGRTLAAPMYPEQFAEIGIRIALPNEQDREFLDHTIYGELALGEVRPEVRQRYLEICRTHIDRDGIDAVILGCTEIPLVIAPDDLPIEVLDTTEIHVAAILAAAG